MIEFCANEDSKRKRDLSPFVRHNYFNRRDLRSCPCGSESAKRQKARAQVTMRIFESEITLSPGM